MFYCVAAILVYMVVTANEGLERVMDLLVYAVSWLCHSITCACLVPVTVVCQYYMCY